MQLRFFFSSRRRHTRFDCDWSSDVCSSDLLVNPRDGEVDPSAMVAAVGRQFRTGAFREGGDVTALTARRSDVLVVAGDDPCEAGIVILATNAYTPQLVPSVKIQPTRAQMIATGPESSRITDMPVYSNFGYRYWRQLPAGHVLGGGGGAPPLRTAESRRHDPPSACQDELGRA